MQEAESNTAPVSAREKKKERLIQNMRMYKIAKSQKDPFLPCNPSPGPPHRLSRFSPSRKRICPLHQMLHPDPRPTNGIHRPPFAEIVQSFPDEVDFVPDPPLPSFERAG